MLGLCIGSHLIGQVKHPLALRNGEIVRAIDILAPSKQARRARHHLQFHLHVVAQLETRAASATAIVLLDVQALHIVQVDVARHTHAHTLHKQRVARQGHIQTPREPEGFARERHETQFHAALTSHLKRVVEIILVEVRTKTRQGAHKTIGEQCHVVAIDVHLAKHVVEIGFHAGAVEPLVDAISDCPLDPFAVRLGASAIVVPRHLLANRHRQHGFAGDVARVGKFHEEGKLADEDVFILLAHVIQAVEHTLIGAKTVVRFFLRIALVAIINQPLDKVHSGVVFLAIFFLAALHHHFAQGVGCRCERNHLHASTAMRHVELACDIAHCRHTHASKLAMGAQHEGAIVVGLRPHARHSEGDRSVRHRFVGDRIAHDARYLRQVLRIGPHRKQQERHRHGYQPENPM